MRRRALLMGGKSEPNTIIGGVGSVITTKSALATKLGISESIIRGFEVVGSDVHAYITSNYTLKEKAFQSDANITFFEDLSGKCTDALSYAFVDTNVTRLMFPSWTHLYSWALSNTPYLTEFIGDNLVTIGSNAVRISGISVANLSNVTLIEAFGLGQSSFTFLNMPALTSMTGAQNLRAITPLTSFIADNLSSINNKDSVFRNLPNCNLISMKKLKTFGNPAVESNCFATLKTNCLIEVNEALLTTNSGSPDAALAWAKANRSAIVEFYDDDGNYVSTL